MSPYRVYLECADDGLCMAHVPELPGCAVRAPGRTEALILLRDAIRDYQDWLRRHGEPAPPPGGPMTLEVVGETMDIGPFDPGDAAALFAPDRRPLTADDLETYFRLMRHSRADLLALVQPPAAAGELLDWQPDADCWSIRRILRHIGNAEEWYLSRLVPPEALPAEWENDADLPIFEFLAMERRTAILGLQQLSPDQLTGVFYPTVWTNHPDEAWTAGKVLRRFLEHEREHTAQVRQVLAAHRQSATRETGTA
jgi:predicted RNase H-like HicB family nuclease/uncharacterized damage-inducible protein DinB